MDKASVVAIRDALLQEGKNRSVTVAFDNGVNMSAASDVIVWNDDKEIVIALCADGEGGSFIAGLPIKVVCSTYENIQFIMGNTNVEKLDSMLDELTSVVNITDENKAVIKKWYERVYGPYDLKHKHYDPIDIIRD